MFLDIRYNLIRYKIKVMAELYIKSLPGTYFLPHGPIWFILTHRLFIVKGYAVILNKVRRLRAKVVSDLAKILFTEHVYFPLIPIWLILRIHRAFG